MERGMEFDIPYSTFHIHTRFVRRGLVLGGSCLVLGILWLPGLLYPILSDTAIYALLGESLWQHGRYELLDVPYAKHLPLHGFLSYPIVTLLGFSIGMKVATLIAAIAVLLLTYLVLRESFSEHVALIAVPLVAIHHGFVLMTMLGSADLLFTALFLAAVYSLLKSEEDPRWYLCAGALIGLASLTRYNGVPLFLVYSAVPVFLRREDLRSGWFYGGLVAGASLFGLWLLRNYRIFGNPFHTTYTGELSDHAPNLFAQAFDNVLYYLNPLHNLLPILLIAAVYGIVLEWRKQPIFVISILGVWMLTIVWWVQAIRFAFPAYPLLIGFAIVGIFHMRKRFPRWRRAFTTAVAITILSTHAAALCLYSYGSCNSWFDRTVGVLPKDLGLTSEGLYTWRQARDAFNALAPEHAIVIVGDIVNVRMQRKFFRDDIRLINNSDAECPYHRISQRPEEGEEILYQTEDHPVTYISMKECM